MEIAMIVLIVALLAFMMFNSRKRMLKMKEEQEAKQRQTVPGAEVMLQGGLFGTVVSFDPEDLDKPAEVELAPGVVVRVHSQAILRVVDPVDELEEPAFGDVSTPDKTEATDAANAPETVEQTRRRLENNG